MVSVVYACQRFCPYLLPRPFVFLTSYTLLPQLVNDTHFSKSIMQWVGELQEFQFSFLVEESTRATLANLLTYKKSPLLIKETIIKKPTSSSPNVDNAFVLFFDGSYRKIHDAALGGIVLYDPQGKLLVKKGLKVDAHINNEAKYAVLEVVK